MFSFPFFLSLARPGSKDVLVCVCGPRGAMPARQASGAARTGSVRASCDYSGVGGEIPACRELPSETINERLSVVNDALSRTLSKSNPAVCGVVCVSGFVLRAFVERWVWTLLWRMESARNVCRTFVGREERI